MQHSYKGKDWTENERNSNKCPNKKVLVLKTTSQKEKKVWLENKKNEDFCSLLFLTSNMCCVLILCGL